MSTTVLVIDSDAGVVEAFRKTLQPHGFIVLGAFSKSQGLELLQQEKPEALLLDIRVPGPPGVELLREVKVLYPALPVITLTAYSTSFTEADAVREGADGYFVKPFDVSSLVAKLKNVVFNHKDAAAAHLALNNSERPRHYFDTLSVSVFSPIGKE